MALFGSKRWRRSVPKLLTSDRLGELRQRLEPRVETAVRAGDLQADRLDFAQRRLGAFVLLKRVSQFECLL